MRLHSTLGLSFVTRDPLSEVHCSPDVSMGGLSASSPHNVQPKKKKKPKPEPLEVSPVEAAPAEAAAAAPAAEDKGTLNGFHANGSVLDGDSLDSLSEQLDTASLDADAELDSEPATSETPGEGRSARLDPVLLRSVRLGAS